MTEMAPRLRSSPARRAALFLAIGALLYAALYAGAEALVYRYSQKNRFFMIASAAAQRYDHVILGASHAMPLDFEDTNREVEKLSGARIMNLSIEGGGVLPNRLLLEYFLARHRAGTVVYIVDSFAFYSAQWNEDRLADAGLLQRAPLDWSLVAALWRHPWARPLLPAYLSGFSKINNRNRFQPDIPDAERTLFRRVYRPVAFLDRQRMAYLYSGKVDPAALARYLEAMRDLIRLAKARGAAFVAIKPPLPERIVAMIQGEAAFDAALKAMLEAEGVKLHDFSRVNNRDAFFYNTDHLNRDGVLAFAKDHLAPLLATLRR